MSMAPSSLAGGRALVAEDDPVLQILIADILTEAGIDHVLVANGGEVLALARQERFDWILMDVFMPVMDGLEATRRLRTAPGTANLCVIGLSGTDNQKSRDACRNAGMSDFLAKPVDADVLFERLHYWRGRPHVPDSTGMAVSDAAAQATTIDLSQLDQLCEGDVERVRRYAGHFLTAFAAGQAAMAQALTDGDLAKMAGEAHRLKSSSRWVGAIGLGDHVATIEQAAKSGDRDRLPHLLDECRLAGADFSACLQQHLKQITNGDPR